MPKKPGNIDIFDAILAEFGPDCIVRMDESSITPCEVIPTGSAGLNAALGIGGWPRGRIVEIYGPASAGKTTLTLHAIAEAQKAGLRCALIDAEHALDPIYAAALGVNIGEVLVSQPDYGEQGLQICQRLADSGQVGLIVVDSVAALTPKAEIDAEVGDKHVGLQARMMAQGLRKITAACNRGKTTVIFINQLRANIGAMGYGPTTTTTGGKSLPYYASVRADIRRIGAIKAGDMHMGNRTRVKVAKNKLAPPFREVEFDILFGKGINEAGEVLEKAVKVGVVEKAGAWLSFEGDKIGQGRLKAVERLSEEPDLLNRIKAALASA